MVEQVLVIPRDTVPGGCDCTGIRAADEAALDQLRSVVREHGTFMDRPLAEEGSSFKQLIPYVVVRDGPRTFLMERTAAGGPAPRMDGGTRRRLGAGVPARRHAERRLERGRIGPPGRRLHRRGRWRADHRPG